MRTITRRRSKLIAGTFALISILGAGAVSQHSSAQTAPTWVLHGSVSVRNGVSNPTASVIQTQTTEKPINLRVRNLGTAAIFMDFNTICYQYQRGQAFPYEITRSMFNVPMRATTGVINVMPARVSGQIWPFRYCTVRAAARPQRPGPGTINVRVEGVHAP